MKCPNCYRIISQGNKFCPYCGVKIFNQSPSQSNRYQSLNNIQTSIDNIEADIRHSSASKSLTRRMSNISLVSRIGISCIPGVFLFCSLLVILSIGLSFVIPAPNNVSISMWLSAILTIGMVAYMASRPSVLINARKRKQVMVNELRKKYEKIYVRTLAPVSYGHIRVTMPDYDSKLLDGNHINYMFFTTGKHSESIVTFPESKYGNHAKYYLLHIRFTPQYNTITNGFSYTDGDDYTYEGLFGSLHTVRSPEEYTGSSSKREIPSIALLTLTPIDFSRTIRITLNDVYQSDINFIIQEGLLGDIDKARVLRAKNL